MRLALVILLLISSAASAQELAKEADYVDAFCDGVIEFVLEDRTRVDCLTPDEAQEYDWGHKSYEAIGQALWYAANTGRRAAIVLIVKTSSDERGVARARKIINHYGLPINVYTADETGVH